MITINDYLSISGHLGEMNSLPSLCVTYLDTISGIVSETDVPTNRSDDAANLNNTVDGTINNITQKYINAPLPMLYNMVVTIQNLVLATNASIDAYLFANSATVTADFAALSSACGYTISAGNIAA